MKIRMIALAGVAVVALAGPAAASNITGWYLGLGAGWDHMGNVEAKFTPKSAGTAQSVKMGTNDGALILGAFGYRFPNRLRIEDEIGYVAALHLRNRRLGSCRHHLRHDQFRL